MTAVLVGIEEAAGFDACSCEGYVGTSATRLDSGCRLKSSIRSADMQGVSGARRFLAGLVVLLGIAACPATSLAAPAITEYTTGLTSNAGPLGIASGPDGNLWFTETSAATGRADHPGGRRHRVPGSDRPAASATSPPGPTATCGSPRSPGSPTGSGASRRRASSPSSPPACRRMPGLRASPPARTATCGSPRRRQPDRADHAGRRRSPSSRPASPPAPAPIGITAGPGRQPVVHRVDGQPDRADHAGGRRSPSSPPASPPEPARTGITAGPDGNLWFTEIDRQPRSGASRPPAWSPSSRPASPPAAGRRHHRRARTATCGSPSSSRRPDRADHPAGVVTEFSAGITGEQRPDASRRARRQPLVHREREPRSGSAGSASVPGSTEPLPLGWGASPQRSQRSCGRTRGDQLSLPVRHNGRIRVRDRHHVGRELVGRPDRRGHGYRSSPQHDLPLPNRCHERVRHDIRRKRRLHHECGHPRARRLRWTRSSDARSSSRWCPASSSRSRGEPRAFRASQVRRFCQWGRLSIRAAGASGFAHL